MGAFKKLASGCGKLLKYGLMAIGAYRVIEFATSTVYSKDNVRTAPKEVPSIDTSTTSSEAQMGD